jgi:thiamine biosynthesis protein ThiS
METSLSCAASFTQPEQVMQVQINGEPREFRHTSLRLSELVEQLSLAPQRIAIEVNRQIVPRANWEQTQVHDGDRVEIVHFVGGGNTGGRRQRQ